MKTGAYLTATQDSPRVTGLSRRRLLRVSGGFALVALLEACARPAPTTAPTAAAGQTTAAATGQPVSGGTVVVAIAGDPSYSNPDPISGSPEQLLGYAIYEGLVRVTPDGTPQPLLARSWTISPDGLTYTFTLQDAQWSDGTPLTSTDVKYTLLTMGPLTAAFATTAKVIASVDDSDPKTAAVTLNQSFGPFLPTLTSHGAAILPAHIFQGREPLSNPASLDQPVGTGPYVMKEWVRGDHITLVKNPKYRSAGRPYLDQIVFKIIPNAAAMVTALEAGDIDYIHNQDLNPSQWATIRSRPNLVLTPSTAPPGDAVMFVNVKRAPYSDPVVRQALLTSIDRNYLKTTVFNNAGEPAKGPIDSRLTWTYNPAVDFDQMYPYDPKKAASALDGAGYPVGGDGTRFTMDFVVPSTSGPTFDQGQALSSMFKAVGINVNLDAVPQAVASDRLAKGDFDTTIAQLTTNGDPALGVSRIYVTDAIGKAFSNYGAYSNPEVDNLFAQGQAATTQADRAKFYFQVQTILAKDLPAFPYYEYQLFNAQTQKLHGIDASQFYPNWSYVYLDK